jgi:predicted SAM-dependent methyltransferase
MIEHIPYASGVRLLQQIYRVLAVGGKVRIATPNFAFLVKLYQEPDHEYINWAANFTPFTPPTALGTVNNFVRHWGHKFIWDVPSMKSTLESVGFADVREFNPGESDDPALRGIEAHGSVISDRWNMLETFVVEATKSTP